MTNLEINNAYVGTDQVEKIYLGQDLVYSSQPGPGPEPGYDTMYLTIEALEDGLLTINSSSSITYSINEGEWETSPDAATLTLSTGDKVRFKGDENTVTSGLFRSSTISSNVYGNIMSLKYGDNFAGQTTVFDCSSMFNGYTGLRDASHLVLPGTTLVASCYMNMFNGCSNLTAAPSLPATTLVGSCYYQMFYDCTNLNYVKCLATDISAASCTTNWVNGVASTGTFVKAASMAGWGTGANGIPSSWTVVDE